MRRMRYISLFSGIEAATVAWQPLGWEPVCFSETAEFPSAVLAYHYPEVPNVGDVTALRRAAKRGKTLPEHLEAALKAAAPGWRQSDAADCDHSSL
jgi:site-specific DNA-cytosine methylase